MLIEPVSDVENISLEKWGLNLSIPLAALPPIAGGQLFWVISANYSSNICNVSRVQEEAPGGALGAMVKEQLGTTTPVYNKLFYNSRGPWRYSFRPTNGRVYFDNLH